MKKILALLVLCVSFASSFQDSIGIDVIIRDFQPGHSDFENFDSRRPFRNEAKRCGNETMKITKAHLDWAAEVYGITGNEALEGQDMMYGAYGNNPELGNKALMHHTSKTSASWGEPVEITTGMVLPDMAYRTPGDEYSAFPVQTPVPVGQNAPCDANDFSSWWQYVPNANYEVKDVLWLKRDPSSDPKNPRYYINSDSTLGYFPLDKYADGSKPNFGPQTLKLWCPPPDTRNPNFKDWEEPKGMENLCNDFWANYDMTTGSSPVVTGHPLARNYNFTMQGYTEFTYFGPQPIYDDLGNVIDSTAGEIFSFAGDDDMWIFIDGHLVADLGGTHHPSEYILHMKSVAAFQSASYGTDWSSGSKHKLHFFYADRQSDGSNLRIYTTMSEVSTPRFGAPVILEFTVLTDEDGKAFLYSSVPLSDQTLAWLSDANGNGTIDYAEYPAQGVNASNQPIQVYSKLLQGEQNFILKSINLAPANLQDPKKGTRYDITFSTEVGAYIPTDGDSLSFRPLENSEQLQQAGELDARPRIMNAYDPSQFVVAPGWANVKSKTTPTTGNIEVPRPVSAEALPFDPEGGIKAGAPRAPVVGVVDSASPVYQADAAVPAESRESFAGSKAGELMLTPYPRAQVTDPNYDVAANVPGFGSTGMANSDATGFTDASSFPQFVKSGFYGAKHDPNQIATSGQTPYMCKGDGTGKNACLTIEDGFEVKQGFKVNVMVYDAMGSYVTKYSQSVTNAELQLIQSKVDGSVEGVSGNGKVLVDLAIYPMDETGRKLGNGVYILVIDFLKIRRTADCDADDFANTPDECVQFKYFAKGGAANPQSLHPERTYEVRKVGYFRP